MIDFTLYTKYIVKVRLFAKSLPVYIDFDKAYPEHVFFYLSFGEEDPSLDDYDLKLSGESIKVDE